MKSLYLASAIIFLMFHLQAKSFPSFPEELTTENDVRAAYEITSSGKPAPKLTENISCLGPLGFCLFRKYKCDSGFMIKQKFNNCPNNRTLKCCVLEKWSAVIRRHNLEKSFQ